MSWDEQLIKACTETDGTPHPHTDHVLTGAKWMREQLRTDEAVERVAAHMCADTMPEQIWPLLNTCAQDEWRAEARAAINALLGDT